VSICDYCVIEEWFCANARRESTVPVYCAMIGQDGMERNQTKSRDTNQDPIIEPVRIVSHSPNSAAHTSMYALVFTFQTHILHSSMIRALHFIALGRHDRCTTQGKTPAYVGRAGTQTNGVQSVLPACCTHGTRPLRLTAMSKCSCTSCSTTSTPPNPCSKAVVWSDSGNSAVVRPVYLEPGCGLFEP
jgi:hypothetical protein